MKKIAIYFAAVILAVTMIMSCSANKKCPAYSKVQNSEVSKSN